MINGIKNNPLTTIITQKSDNEKKKTGFAEFLKDYVNNVNEKQVNADKLIDKFLQGEEKDITNVVMAVQKADVSLQLFLQIRNKLVQAYQEVMRMQV